MVEFNLFPIRIQNMKLEVISPETFSELICEYTDGKLEAEAYLMNCKWCNKIYTIRVNSFKIYEEKGFCCEDCIIAYYLKNKPQFRLLNKKQQKEYLLEIKNTVRCIVCGYKRFVVWHHKDQDRKNNNEENLIPLCPNHHYLVHRGEIKLGDYTGGK